MKSKPQPAERGGGGLVNSQGAGEKGPDREPEAHRGGAQSRDMGVPEMAPSASKQGQDLLFRPLR